MGRNNIGYILANFGGPRNIREITPFLKALLTDQDVIRTRLPPFFHRMIFSFIAKKRAHQVTKDYESIGGKSPIFDDTEALAEALRGILQTPVITFHRYLPATHQDFIQAIQNSTCDAFHVFPMFPQFSYATTGSIARWFDSHLSSAMVKKFHWVQSYSTHPAFIDAHQCSIRDFLTANRLREEETVLLFSAHGIPRKFVLQGELYGEECHASYQAVMQTFPKALGRLSFQSRFGPGEWIKPYTEDLCQGIHLWHQERPNIVFVPISFTSDHMETLFEVEKKYMSTIRDQGLRPFRVPALADNRLWIEGITTILKESNLCYNHTLIRRNS